MECRVRRVVLISSDSVSISSKDTNRRVVLISSKYTPAARCTLNVLFSVFAQQLKAGNQDNRSSLKKVIILFQLKS
jgi:hypothetical protein